MKEYKKRFQRWWMDTDHKPNRKTRRLLEKQNRMEEREIVRKELDEAIQEDQQDSDVKLLDQLD